MQFTLYQLGALFFVYAFMGWCAEVVFSAVRRGRFVNRGFLNGPICPIYGFGLVAVVLALIDLKDNIIVLILGSCLLTTALEFITGWVLEKVFHAKWWDYSNNRFNIKGYVCLEFSIIWGLAATFVVRIIHPIVLGMINGIPPRIGTVLLCAFAAIMATDLAATVAAICNLQKRLRLLTALASDIHGVSDHIGGNISEAALALREQTSETVELYAELKQMSDAHHAEEKKLFEAHRAEERTLLDAIREKEKTRRDVRFAVSQAEVFEKASELREALEKKSFTFRRISRAFPDLGLRGDEKK